MRRIAGAAAVLRAVKGVAGASTASGCVAQEQRRLFQAAILSTNGNFVSSVRSRLVAFDRISGGFSGEIVAGRMQFSTAASAVVEEAGVKESAEQKFLPKEVVLYQYEACPFCNKVRAFLDYSGIRYKIVEVNPISKKEIKWSDYKKVPILMVDGEVMVDSSAIIDKLNDKINPEAAPSSANEDSEETKWRNWVDNHLIHILSPNIYRTVSEALESFDYITSHGNFSFTEKITAKYAGAAAMYFVSKKLKKRHNITDERAALYEAAETWVNALEGRNFLGGSKPNLGDLAVYGVLRPIRYLTSGKDMVEHTRIGDWYSRMENIIKSSSQLAA